MIRVLLADDESMIRAGVRSILENEPTIEVVAEAGDGHDAVELTLRHRPNVALLDIRMPRLDGLQAAAQIRDIAPATAVMMLTTFSEDAYVAQALAEGASGFVLKSGDPRELIAGVLAVADGGAYLSPQVARRVIAHFNNGTTGVHITRGSTARVRLHETLTDRERDVLRLVGRGKSNAEIASRLHVVEGTVKGHVSTILGRLGLRNRVEAALLAYQAGLVDPIDGE